MANSPEADASEDDDNREHCETKMVQASGFAALYAMCMAQAIMSLLGGTNTLDTTGQRFYVRAPLRMLVASELRLIC